jgi:hypothetical protein
MNAEERASLVAQIRNAVGESEAVRLLSSRLGALEQIVADTKGGNPQLAGNRANPFQSDAFKSRMNALNEGQLNTGRIQLAGVGLKGMKSLTNPGSGDSPGDPTQFPTRPDRGPTIPPVQRPLNLIDVLQSIPVGSNTYEHVRLSRTPNAGVQATEGAAKNQTVINSDLVTVPIATVAHWTDASKQVLGDNVGLSLILSNLLAFDVLDKMERLLLQGDTNNAGEFDGLLKLATPIASTEAHNADVISDAIATMWTAGFVANALVIHPTMWHRIQTERAGNGGDGQYVAGGWNNPAPPSIWSLPVVRTPSVGEQDALLLDTSRIRLLDREQVQVLVSTEHDQNFTKNLVTMLAEARGGLAVYDQGAVGLVELPITA